MEPMRQTTRSCLHLVGFLAASAVLLACEDRRGGAVETFEGVTGTVVSLEPDRRQITVDHDDIPGLMGAMTMPFDVEDPAVLLDLKPGDRIRFTLRRIDGRLTVRAVEPAPAAAVPQGKSSPASEAGLLGGTP